MISASDFQRWRSFRTFPMSYATRVPSLDGLRGIAALGVMLFHFNIFFLPQAHLPFVGWAYLSVDLFFLLSGFIMAHVYGRLLASNWRAHWMHYGRARFARIYPLFAVTTLAMLASVALFHMPLPLVSFSGRSLALQPVLLQQWASGLSWNYPSWSISSEAECYVAFIFSAGVLLAGRHPRLIAACCAGAVAALSVVNDGSLNCFVGPLALLRALAEFSLGVLLYRAHSDSGKFSRKWIIVAVIPLVTLAKITHLDFFMVGAFGCLIYYGVSATDAVGRFLNSRPLIALGNWSYGIYLWQAPMHYAVMASFAAVGYPISSLGQLGARLLVLATGVLVVGVSALSYPYFEMPLRRFINRFHWAGLPPSGHVAD
jgi:peptidoglycan/LPS O-acetylase OafA/YrhL